MSDRHNLALCGPVLPLSEVGAGGRLTHTVARHRALTPRRQRYPHELIAARIRLDGGSVWGAIAHFGVSYSHACRIRRGWRPGSDHSANSLRTMLRYRHGVSAWDGDSEGEAVSMYRASPMPWCLLCWRDHR